MPAIAIGFSRRSIIWPEVRTNIHDVEGAVQIPFAVSCRVLPIADPSAGLGAELRLAEALTIGSSSVSRLEGRTEVHLVGGIASSLSDVAGLDSSPAERLTLSVVLLSAMCHADPSGGTGGKLVYRCGGQRRCTRLASGFERATSLLVAAVMISGAVWLGPASASAQGGRSVLAWGTGGNGQLGNGTLGGWSNSSPLPVEVSLPAGTSATAVATASQDAYALTPTGKVYAWGYNGHGELGNGNSSLGQSDAPVLVRFPPGLEITAIAGEGSASLALTSAGQVYTWGYDPHGYLGGQGASTESDVPVLVPFPAGVTITAIAGEEGGVGLALASTGQVYTWGTGELGVGNRTGQTNVPILVSLPPGVTAIAGETHTGLALTATGQVYAWGYGGWGDRGDGTTANVLPLDIPVLVLLPSDVTVTAIAGQRDVGMALTSAGQVYAWGDTGAAEAHLGNGSSAGSATPQLVSLPFGVRASAIGSTGTNGLVLTSRGQVLAWGDNRNGQLGNGEGLGYGGAIYSNVPVSVKLPQRATVSALSKGFGRTPLAVALLEEPSLLRVETSPPLPSQVLVDGVPRDSWGLSWLWLAPGTHTVGFTHVEGFTEPVPQAVNVVAGQTASLAAIFVRRGLLRVTTSPAVPATISVDGIARDNWGMWTDLPVGSHQVCFGAVAGYNPPPCQPVNLAAGALTTVTGQYTSNPIAPGPAGTGQLRVTTSPPVASQILIDGVPRDSWGAWLDLAPGTYTVGYAHIEGFTEPSPQTVVVAGGSTTSLTGAFARRGVLRVTTTPAVPATISVDGLPRDNWGMWTDLPTGTHQVCFGPMAGHVAPPCQDVNLTAATLSTVNGSY